MGCTLCVTVAAVLAFSVQASAQGCQRTAPHAEGYLPELAASFYDPDYAEDRGTTIQLLSAADTAYVVRDDSTCQMVLNQALAHLRQHHPLWAAGQEGNYQATVYRFGPYYAVEMVPEDRTPTTTGTHDFVRNNHDATLMVYRISDLALLRLLV